jgi:hypothetical protein
VPLSYGTDRAGGALYSHTQIGLAARRFHGVNGIQQNAAEGAAYFATGALNSV